MKIAAAVIPAATVAAATVKLAATVKTKMGPMMSKSGSNGCNGQLKMSKGWQQSKTW